MTSSSKVVRSGHSVKGIGATIRCCFNFQCCTILGANLKMFWAWGNWPRMWDFTKQHALKVNSQSAPLGHLGEPWAPLEWTQWWANIIKWTWTNIRIYLDATLCTKWISKCIWMQYIYRTNIQTFLYSGNSTNMNTNYLHGSFYSNIWIFVLITDWRNILKGLTHVFFE